MPHVTITLFRHLQEKSASERGCFPAKMAWELNKAFTEKQFRPGKNPRGETLKQKRKCQGYIAKRKNATLAKKPVAGTHCRVLPVGQGDTHMRVAAINPEKSPRNSLAAALLPQNHKKTPGASVNLVLEAAFQAGEGPAIEKRAAHVRFVGDGIGVFKLIAGKADPVQPHHLISAPHR